MTLFIGSNLPIVKPIKTAWDSGKEHQVRGTNCRCAFVLPMLGTKLPGMGDTSTKAPSHNRTAGSKEWRTDTALQTRFSAEQSDTEPHSSAFCRFVTTTESIRLVQTDGLGKPTESETYSLGTDCERDTMPEGRKND